MRTLFQIIQQEFQKGNDLVLASIVASSGSTPRGAGSRMLVGKKGRIAEVLSNIVQSLWHLIFLKRKNPVNMNSG